MSLISVGMCLNSEFMPFPFYEDFRYESARWHSHHFLATGTNGISSKLKCSPCQGHGEKILYD